MAQPCGPPCTAMQALWALEGLAVQSGLRKGGGL